MPDYVYILRHPRGVWKVGCSINPDRRCKQLSVAYKANMVLHKVWGSDYAGSIESTVHTNLAQYRIKRFREMYDAPLETIVSAIDGALAQWEREWNWERTNHGLARARERGVVGGQPSHLTDKQIKDALKKGKTPGAAAKILGCAKVTIKRRQEMWAQGRKLKLEVRK